MEMCSLEDFIYHYTTINTLALILKSSCLRFNSLRNVDDREEGLTKDMGNKQSCVFVSCWTKDKSENIALWNMYSGNMSGVRIGLNKDLLNIKTGGYREVANIKNTDISCFANDYYTEIEYCDDNKIKILNKEQEAETELKDVELKNLGTRKNKLWIFQQEVRFKLYAAEKNKLLKFSDKPQYSDYLKFFLGKGETEINYIDLELDINIFKNAEFMIGPKSSDSDKILLEALIEKYLPSHTGFVESRLKLKK